MGGDQQAHPALFSIPTGQVPPGPASDQRPGGGVLKVGPWELGGQVIGWETTAALPTPHQAAAPPPARGGGPGTPTSQRSPCLAQPGQCGPGARRGPCSRLPCRPVGGSSEREDEAKGSPCNPREGLLGGHLPSRLIAGRTRQAGFLPKTEACSVDSGCTHRELRPQRVLG